MSIFRRFISIVLIVTLVFGMSLFNLAEDVDNDIFLIVSNDAIGETEETYETTKKKEFIEETRPGLSINEYEREELEKMLKRNGEKVKVETTKREESSREREVINQIKSKAEEFISKRIEKSEYDNSLNPKVIINAKYDRYEIFFGKNTGRVRISDDNKVYYNSSTSVKTIRDMDDEKGNSLMLLNIASKVKVFDFDESNDSYVLLPEGFVDNLIIKQRDNKCLSPDGIKKLNYVKVDLAYNGTDLGAYDLYEYFILYYLSCYEGVLGDYYYR